MTVTFDPLSTAITGLNVSQQLLDITAQNASNANTQGYTRKTLAVQTVVSGGKAIGVNVGNIQRQVDTSLQKDYWNQVSTSGQNSAINTYLGKVQSLYGTADSQTSFSAYLSAVKNDFTQLSASPDNTILQQQTVTDAATFASSMNQTALKLNSLRNDTETDISQSVSTINTQLQTIATLNTQIAQQTAQSASTAALGDQRDQAVEALSKELKITYFTNTNGVMVIQTANGQPLADTVAHSLIFNSQPIGPNSSTTAGVYIDSLSGTNLATAATNPGGNLGGLLQLRDQILPQQQAQLDELAEQTANRFNAQGVKLFTNSAGAVPANVPTTYAGFASIITVNPAVVSNPALVQQGTAGGPALQAGDNTVINNVLNYTFGLNQDSLGTVNVPFNTTNLGAAGNLTSGLPAISTLENFAQQTITSQASQASQYTSQGTFSDNYRDTLNKSLTDETGVNLDQEISNLTIYQHSYAAAAEVIKTVNQLMTDLLNAVG